MNLNDTLFKIWLKARLCAIYSSPRPGFDRSWSQLNYPLVYIYMKAICQIVWKNVFCYKIKIIYDSTVSPIYRPLSSVCRTYYSCLLWRKYSIYFFCFETDWHCTVPKKLHKPRSKLERERTFTYLNVIQSTKIWIHWSLIRQLTTVHIELLIYSKVDITTRHTQTANQSNWSMDRWVNYAQKTIIVIIWVNI